MVDTLNSVALYIILGFIACAGVYLYMDRKVAAAKRTTESEIEAAAAKLARTVKNMDFVLVNEQRRLQAHIDLQTARAVAAEKEVERLRKLIPTPTLPADS